ncbi:UNVERIFIED_CONTAM: hypothetical protein GTU68_063874 [Idotea baltica]|nr:hypothetical protein [Idotea baltica]
MSSFLDLGIHKNYIKSLKELGIKDPTEIQQQAIPILLQSKTDFIGLAQTGTGKTAAYGLPILHNINPKKDKIQALILSPTRELVQQIKKQLFKFTKYNDVKIFCEGVYGGEKIDIQIRNLKRTTHIIVATPGRLVDLIQREIVDLKNIETLVLDEADEMLSMGFKNDLTTILKTTKGSKNTWLFSATMPEDYVSARGIDVNNLGFVIHHQLPEHLEYYTHRSGRTARAGKTGASIALVLPNEISKVKEIESALGIKIKQKTL